MGFAAEKFDFNQEQADALEDGKQGFRAQDARLINQAKDNIWKKVSAAAEFNNDEKQDIFHRLKNEVSDTNADEIKKFGDDIEKKQQEISQMIKSYRTQIDANRDVFGVDKKRGLNAGDQYIKEFMELSADEKKKWLNSLEKDIQERQSLYARAKELMPDKADYVGTLRRSEVKKLVEELEKAKGHIDECEKIFKENPGLFSAEEIAEYKEDLFDTERGAQSKIAAEVRSELQERKDLADAYNSLPDNYKNTLGKFNQLYLPEKRVGIKKIDSAITSDYRKKQFDHAFSRHISNDSKDAAFSYIKNLPVQGKAKAIQMLDSQFKAEKERSDKFEKTLGQLKGLMTETEMENERVEYYDSDSEKKDKKIEKLAKKLSDKPETTKEETELTKKFTARLEKELREKNISKKTMERAMDKWKKGDVSYKRKTVQNFESDMEARKALTERFMNLPKEIQDKNKDWFNHGHYRRLNDIAEIERSIQSASEKEGSLAERQKKLDHLTTLATAADRKKDYETALTHYQQIIDMDRENSDPIAQSRINDIKKIIGKTPDSSANTGKEKIASAISDIEKNEDIKSAVEEKTIVQKAAEAALKSERLHQTVNASNKTKDVKGEDAEIAQKLGKDGYVLDKDGTASKVVDIKVDETMTTEKKTTLKKSVVDNVVNVNDPNQVAKIYQFRDKNGQAVTGAKGMEKAAKIEETIEQKIEDRVLQRMNLGGRPATDTDAISKRIQEQLDKKDFTKKLAA